MRIVGLAWGLCVALAVSAATAQGPGRAPGQGPPGQIRIYGGDLMSEEEIDAYRATLGSLETPEQRAAFRIEHRKKIDQRARQLGVEVGGRGRPPGARGAQGRNAAGDRTPVAGNRPAGWELMTDAERAEYVNTVRSLKTQEERNAFRSQHRQEMEERARERGVSLEPVGAGGPGGPAGRRIYGQQLMTEDEIRVFREKLTSLRSPQERREYQQRHVEEMQRRAREQGVELPPPGTGRARAGRPRPGGAPPVGTGPGTGSVP